jgi:hypothetical protein
VLETVEQRNALLAQIEKARNSSVIAYVLHDNAMVADDAIPQLYDKLQALGKRDRIDLLLYARSGVIEVCWRVLNLLREYCDFLGVIVGTRVQGAASLLALGADEIVMGPLSELGGMEAVRRHPLLPHDDGGQPIPLSLGEVRALLSFLSEHSASGGDDRGRATDGGGEVTGEGRKTKSRPGLEAEASNLQSEIGSPQLDSVVLSTLLQHIHPLVIAHLQQSDSLSREVTEKALRLHMHVEDSERIRRLVGLFNGGFRSPLYTASRAELEEAGLPVTVPDKELWAAIWGVVQLYHSTLYTDRPESAAPGAFYRYVCLLEAVGRLTGLRQTFTQSEGQERIIQIRWDTAIRGPGPGPSMGPGGRSNN